MVRSSILTFVAAAALFGMGGLICGASTISVAPIQVHLTPRAPSTVLTIQNQGNEPVRLQITGEAWSEGPEGSIHLSPTADLVFFPSLLTIGGGETRSIRIGTTAPPQEREKDYRIYIEELPSLLSQLEPGDRAVVMLRTKIGIPVYYDPPAPVEKIDVMQANASNGKLMLRLVGSGTVHVVIPSIRVIGLNAGGDRAFEREIAHSYVLPGATRGYTVGLPLCSSAVKLDIVVNTDAGAVKDAVPYTSRCTAKK